MSDVKRVYSALGYLIKQKHRSSVFYLAELKREYHLISDGDIVILLIHDQSEETYEVSTLNLVGQWVDLDLDNLMMVDGGSLHDLIWRHLKYFNITPDLIYSLYANDTFEYCPRYEAEEFDENEDL
jgi:hypothetical protein